MSKKPIDELGRTTLPWPEYERQANILIQDVPKGTPWQEYLADEIGTGYWDFEGKKEVYGFNRTTNKKTGKWKLKRKRAKVRAANLATAAMVRAAYLKAANEGFVEPEDLKAGKKLQKEIQSVPGRNADHILEVQTFGPAIEQLNKEYATGAITKAEYDKRFKVLKESNIGDSVKNLQDLSIAENQNKKNIVEAKNKALQKMEELNPSTRHLDPKYKKAMELAKNYEVSKIGKAAKIVKPALRFVTGVGTGIVLLNAKAQAEEAVENPTWQNKVQAGIAGADAALEGVELATGGVGGLLTTPLQLALLVADQMVHQTEDEFERPTYDYASRRRYRTGQE